MKLRFLLSFFLMAWLPVGALEERTFRSFEGSRTFVGEAVGYDTQTELVTIRRAGGDEVNFKLSLLCAEDQAYIRKNREALEASRTTVVAVTEVAGESKPAAGEKGGEGAAPIGFSIVIQNNSGEVMEEVTADYTLYYRKGHASGLGKIAEMTGSLEMKSLSPQESASAETKKVKLVREARSESEVNCCSGRVLPNGHWPDVLLGCKVEVKVAGKWVKTHYSVGQLPTLIQEE